MPAESAVQLGRVQRATPLPCIRGREHVSPATDVRYRMSFIERIQNHIDTTRH